MMLLTLTLLKIQYYDWQDCGDWCPPKQSHVLKHIEEVQVRSTGVYCVHLSTPISQKHIQPQTDLYSSSWSVKLNVISERLVLNILLSNKSQKEKRKIKTKQPMAQCCLVYPYRDVFFQTHFIISPAHCFWLIAFLPEGFSAVVSKATGSTTPSLDTSAIKTNFTSAHSKQSGFVLLKAHDRGAPTSPWLTFPSLNFFRVAWEHKVHPCFLKQKELTLIEVRGLIFLALDSQWHSRWGAKLGQYKTRNSLQIDDKTKLD